LGEGVAMGLDEAFDQGVVELAVMGASCHTKVYI
jgi:hypothetical protein